MYLIVGANGQLGSELQLILGDKAHYADVEQLDITKEEETLEYVTHIKPDVIINCAAYTAVDRAEQDEDMAYAVNAKGPGNLAKAALSVGAKMIHVSTDYVFDGSACVPYTETDAVNPVSVYGRTKLSGECLAMETGCSLAIVRTAWLYSRFGHNFVKTMQKLGAERDELTVVFDQVGTPTNAADLAVFLMALADNMEDGSQEVYHFSNEGVASWYDFALAIMELSNLSCRVLPVRSSAFPTPAKRPSYSVLDKAKIKSVCNKEIPYWRESLAALLALGEKDTV